MPAGLSLVTNTSRLLDAAPVRSNAPDVVGKFGRLREAGDVGVAGGVDGDARAHLVARAAEERRVREAGVDDQLARRVVVADVEAVGEPVDRVPARDRCAVLEGDRRRIAQGAGGGVDQQRAAVDSQSGRAAVGELDVAPGRRPAARGTRT